MKRDETIGVGGMLLVALLSGNIFFGYHFFDSDREHQPDIHEETYVMSAIETRAMQQLPPGELCDISKPPELTGKIRLTQTSVTVAYATPVTSQFSIQPTEVECKESKTKWTLLPSGSSGRNWIARRE